MGILAIVLLSGKRLRVERENMLNSATKTQIKIIKDMLKTLEIELTINPDFNQVAKTLENIKQATWTLKSATGLDDAIRIGGTLPRKLTALNE